MESLASVLCCRVGQEGRGQSKHRYFPAIIMDHKPCCPVHGCIWVSHQAAVFKVWSDQTLIGMALDGLGNRLYSSIDETSFLFALLVPGEVV